MGGSFAPPQRRGVRGYCSQQVGLRVASLRDQVSNHTVHAGVRAQGGASRASSEQTSDLVGAHVA